MLFLGFMVICLRPFKTILSCYAQMPKLFCLFFQKLIVFSYLFPLHCQSKGEDAHCYTTNETSSSILLSDYTKYVLICNLNDNSALNPLKARRMFATMLIEDSVDNSCKEHFVLIAESWNYQPEVE